MGHTRKRGGADRATTDVYRLTKEQANGISALCAVGLTAMADDPDVSTAAMQFAADGAEAFLGQMAAYGAIGTWPIILEVGYVERATDEVAP